MLSEKERKILRKAYSVLETQREYVDVGARKYPPNEAYLLIHAMRAEKLVGVREDLQVRITQKGLQALLQDQDERIRYQQEQKTNRSRFNRQALRSWLQWLIGPIIGWLLSSVLSPGAVLSALRDLFK